MPATYYSPIGQPGGYAVYSSLSDLLTEGFPDDTVVKVEIETAAGYATVQTTTTIAALAGRRAADGTDVYTLTRADLREIIGALTDAYDTQTRVRVAVDGGLKLDTGDGAGWTLPYGTDTTGRS